MSPRFRELLSGLALSAASMAFVVAAAEVGLRVAGFVPQHFKGTARLHDTRWTMLLDCYPTNPRGYFDVDLRDPAARERFGAVPPRRFDAVAERAPYAVEFRYNSLRFRDVEIGPRRPGVRRVMVLGDSFTEGQGVKEADTYPRVLGRLLNAARPGTWEVFNCGRRGADFPEIYQAFEEILRYEPDVLVYGMVLNDADQSTSFHSRQTYVNDWILDRGRLLDGRTAPGLGLLQSRVLAYVRDRVESYRIGRESTRWYLDMYGPPNRDGWERTQRYLREMDRRMRERGGRLLIAYWPLLVSLEGHYPFASVDETIGRFCQAAGIPKHDLLPVLRGRPTASLWVHPVDMHPNDLAHRLAAESLAPVVRELMSR